MTLTEQLKDIQWRMTHAKSPATEWYDLLFYELMPLVWSNIFLAELFQAQVDGEKSCYLNVRAFIENDVYRISILDSNDPVVLGSFLADVKEVISELTLWLPEKEESNSRAGRPSSLTFDKKIGVLSYGKKPTKSSCQITPNTKMFILSQKMIHPSVQFGDSKSWTDLYEDIYGVEPSSNEDWTKIDQLVRSINKKLSIAHIPPALKFAGGSKGFVTRVL